MYNYLVIEKDFNTINNIKNILSESTDYKCVGVTHDNDVATNTILKISPNLVFLNIDNIIDDPFRFVTDIHQYVNNFPTFIAVSSFKDKAYRTIKSGFFDMILNPVSELDLRKSVLSFEKRVPIITKKNICIKSYQDYQYLDTEQILFIKADNNTTDIHMNDGSTINSFKTLKSFEDHLPGEFLRIHRSYIINKNYVSRIHYGKLTCTMKNNSYDIPFSKKYFDVLDSINDKLTKFTYQFLN